MDSVSVATSFKETAEKGIIFCSISDASQEHQEAIKKYLGTVVPVRDNFFSSFKFKEVFSDGSFCYIPKGVQCPMELSHILELMSFGTGQFERTLLIADEGSQVSYLEGCTA